MLKGRTPERLYINDVLYNKSHRKCSETMTDE
jgi:hypothetical protein